MAASRGLTVIRASAISDTPSVRVEDRSPSPFHCLAAAQATFTLHPYHDKTLKSSHRFASRRRFVRETIDNHLCLTNVFADQLSLRRACFNSYAAPCLLIGCTVFLRCNQPYSHVRRPSTGVYPGCVRNKGGRKAYCPAQILDRALSADAHNSLIYHGYLRASEAITGYRRQG